MADPLEAFLINMKEFSVDLKKRAVLYNAFCEGWSVGDQMKRPDPPRRIFDNQVDNDLIEEFYDGGRLAAGRNAKSK